MNNKFNIQIDYNEFITQKDEDGGLNLKDNFLTAENASDLVSEDSKLYDNKDINEFKIEKKQN